MSVSPISSPASIPEEMLTLEQRFKNLKGDANRLLASIEERTISTLEELENFYSTDQALILSPKN